MVAPPGSPARPRPGAPAAASSAAPFRGKDLRTVLGAAYYGGLLVLLALAVTGTLGAVLPHELAKELREDDEALLLAVVLSGWIQLVRPRLPGARREWPVTLLAGTVLLLLGLWTYTSRDLPVEVGTFSEPLLALALLLPYVQLRRPLPRLLVLGVPVGVLMLILLDPRQAIVIRGSELFAMLMLVPLGLDIVDRRTLEPAARTSALLRWSWYTLLIAAPLLLSLVLRDAFTGLLGQVVTYAVGVQEAWLGLLLVHLYAALDDRLVSATRRRPSRPLSC